MVKFITFAVAAFLIGAAILAASDAIRARRGALAPSRSLEVFQITATPFPFPFLFEPRVSDASADSTAGAFGGNINEADTYTATQTTPRAAQSASTSDSTTVVFPQSSSGGGRRLQTLPVIPQLDPFGFIFPFGPGVSGAGASGSAQAFGGDVNQARTQATTHASPGSPRASSTSSAKSGGFPDSSSGGGGRKLQTSYVTPEPDQSPFPSLLEHWVSDASTETTTDTSSEDADQGARHTVLQSTPGGEQPSSTPEPTRIIVPEIPSGAYGRLQPVPVSPQPDFSPFPLPFEPWVSDTSADSTTEVLSGDISDPGAYTAAQATSDASRSASAPESTTVVIPYTSSGDRRRLQTLPVTPKPDPSPFPFIFEPRVSDAGAHSTAGAFGGDVNQADTYTTTQTTPGAAQSASGSSSTSVVFPFFPGRK